MTSHSESRQPHLKKWGLRLFWSSGRLAPDPLDFGRTLLPGRDPAFYARVA